MQGDKLMDTPFEVGDYLAFGIINDTVYKVDKIWGTSKLGVPRAVVVVGRIENGIYDPYPENVQDRSYHETESEHTWKSMGWICVNDIVKSDIVQHPNYKVIRKIQQMNVRRKEAGYAF